MKKEDLRIVFLGTPEFAVESLDALVTNGYNVVGVVTMPDITPRLFEPLGIEVPFWETDSNGVEAGGWGLYITTEDLAKVADCYLHGGKSRGKQILPAEWVGEATKNQLGEIKQPSDDPDANSGYGYCFWMNAAIPNSYRMDGMFSQFAINLPDYDASIITTAAIPVESQAREALWRFFPKAFINEGEEKKPTKLDTALLARPEIGRAHV